MKKTIVFLIIFFLAFMFLVNCQDNLNLAPYGSNDRSFEGVPPGGPPPEQPNPFIIFPP